MQLHKSLKTWLYGTRFTFLIDPLTDHVVAILEKGASIARSPTPTKLLGYNENRNSFQCPVDQNELNFRSDVPARLNLIIPDQLFVYSDIVGNELVGDTVAPLLRIVSVHDRPHGSVVTKTFDLPHYVRVAKRYFDTIEIDIRTSLGQPAAFEFGQSTCKLHFRPCRKPKF